MQCQHSSMHFSQNTQTKTHSFEVMTFTEKTIRCVNYIHMIRKGQLIPRKMSCKVAIITGVLKFYNVSYALLV